jgi:hypothetical protein
MAKQTFTTGQVLTAAQMTSLQQTAMGGGDTTAKTTSYVLVAADAGTVVAMNAAGATTITVNTSLFAAGDTVFIQNRGAGVCTITAGTATVSTAGSLALGQHEGGTLYFTATGAAVFYDFVQTGAVSPLTTKGDVWGYSTLDARIPVGANDTVLTADSTQALGVKWATPAAGGMTLISTTTLTGSSISLTSIPSTYTNLRIVVENYYASAQDYLCVRFNNDSGATSYYMQSRNFENSTGSNSATGTTYIGTIAAYNTSAAQYLSFMQINIPKYAATSGSQLMVGLGYGGSARNGWSFSGVYNNRSAAISSIQLFPLTGTMTAGTVYLYGEK